MTSAEEVAQFSKIRSYLWPVHKHELKKLLPMLAIFFLLSFDYNILRCMKDTLIITAKHSGAETIPFIKVWVMFPMSLVLTYIFIRFSNRFSRETVFYLMLSLFLAYFSLFAFVIYPLGDALLPHETADRLQAILPIGCKGLIAMYRYWTFTSFYVMSELWGNIVLFLLFWGFANQVTKLDEARRFYGLFGIGTNFSGIAAGQISIFIAELPFNPSFPFGKDEWAQSLTLLVSLVLLSGIATMFVFRWLNTTVLKDPRLCPNEPFTEKKVKKKFSMRENLRYLATSPYMLSLAAIVISYNLVINLVEILWKHEVRLLYPDPKDYNTYMNQVTTVIGVLATLSALFISGNAIRKCGWTFTALITPAVLLLTSIGFFGFFFLKDSPAILIDALAWSPLSIVVFFGSMQNCFSRAAKYTVFDATKEMAFIPLTPEAKIKGKAAIDGVCNRLGKSGGSVIYQALLLAFSTITASAPYVAFFLFSIIALWIISVRVLGRKFHEVTSTASSLPGEGFSAREVAVAASVSS